MLPLAEVHVTGHMAFVPPYIFDLKSGRLLGKVDGRGYALSVDGHVLQLGESTAGDLPLGPLRWQTARQ
jgi:hypothetical protein